MSSATLRPITAVGVNASDRKCTSGYQYLDSYILITGIIGYQYLDSYTLITGIIGYQYLDSNTLITGYLW